MSAEELEAELKVGRFVEVQWLDPTGWGPVKFSAKKHRLARWTQLGWVIHRGTDQGLEYVVLSAARVKTEGKTHYEDATTLPISLIIKVRRIV